MPTSVNPRIYYPIHAVGFAPLGTNILSSYTTTGLSGYRAAKGVQSFSSNINFQLEPVFQLGQLELYENVENIPAVEATIEKVVDGRALLEHLATPGATVSTLAGRYNDSRTMIAAAYYPITQEFGSGTPLSITVMSGMYVSAITINIPVEGTITENVTFVGNDKTWYNAPSGTPWTSGTYFTGLETPLATGMAGTLGLVQRRQNVNMTLSRWPTDVPGISGLLTSGVNPTLADGSLGAHIQNVSFSVNLGRTDLFELGRRGPYFRYANFPTEVTTTIEFIAGEYGDQINAAQESTANLSNQYIKVVLDCGITIDLGTKNKLRTVTTNGGDTGGGNVSTSYEYVNYNSLRVIASGSDPAGLTS